MAKVIAVLDFGFMEPYWKDKKLPFPFKLILSVQDPKVSVNSPEKGNK